MASRYLVKFDWYVLKPIWALFIVLACLYCFRQEWLIGVALIAMNFLVGMVAAAVHRGKTVAELAAGMPRVWLPPLSLRGAEPMSERAKV